MMDDLVFASREEVKAAFMYLLDISCRQLMLIEGIKEEEGWEEELLSILEEKDKAISYIDEMFSGLGEGAGVLKEDPEIRELMLFIKQQEERSQQVLREKAAGIGEKLKSLRQSEKARRAYSGEDMESEGWFFDRYR